MTLITSELNSKHLVDENQPHSLEPQESLDSTRTKRTLYMSEIFSTLDSSKLIYPKGVVTKINDSKEESTTARRVELFATDEKDAYGILRTLFVASSSAMILLHIAEASNNVIHVRALGSRDASSYHKSSRQIIGDRLLLRKMNDGESAKEENSIRAETPNLIVPPRWRERMNLKPGDRLIVSNPIENYAVPPPNV